MDNPALQNKVDVLLNQIPDYHVLDADTQVSALMGVIYQASQFLAHPTPSGLAVVGAALELNHALTELANRLGHDDASVIYLYLTG